MSKKQKEKVKHGYVVFGLLALVVVLGGVGNALASSDSPAREYVAKSLADFAASQGDSSVANKLADWLIGDSEEEKTEAFGQTSAFNQGQASAFGENCLIDVETLSTGPVDGVWCEGVLVENIGGGGTVGSSTYFGVQNNFREPIYVTGAVIKFAGSPSTTILFSMGTSTVSSIAYNATAVPNSVMDRIRVVTSTPENSVITSYYGPITTLIPFPGGTATGTNKWTLWEQDDWLVGHMRAEDPTWAVTSTVSRGFTTSSLVWVKYARLSTSTPRF